MIIAGSCLESMQPKAYKELENAMDLSNIEIINYVAVDNKLMKISLEVISLSKNLSKLKEKIDL